MYYLDRFIVDVPAAAVGATREMGRCARRRKVKTTQPKFLLLVIKTAIKM